MKKRVLGFQKGIKLNESEYDLPQAGYEGNVSNMLASLFYYNTKNGDVVMQVDSANINDLRGVYDSIADDPDVVCWVIVRDSQEEPFQVSFINGEVMVEDGRVIEKITKDTLRGDQWDMRGKTRP